MSSATRLDVRRRNNKRLRCTVQPFPAVSAREHEEVGKALLSVVRGGGGAADEPTQNSMGVVMPIAAALERVAVWRCRIPRLSHAVESTAALAQILHRMDDHSSSSSSSTTSSSCCTTMELRLSLSCAILRTINGLADTLQQQRSTACSVAVLCQELGVPTWLVDIRHEATHNQLPPLPTLRLAANVALAVLCVRVLGSTGAESSRCVYGSNGHSTCLRVRFNGKWNKGGRRQKSASRKYE